MNWQLHEKNSRAILEIEKARLTTLIGICENYGVELDCTCNNAAPTRIDAQELPRRLLVAGTSQD
jgi:hypothetical protein